MTEKDNNSFKDIAHSLELRELELVHALEVIGDDGVDRKTLSQETGLPSAHLKRLLGSMAVYLEPSSGEVTPTSEGAQKFREYIHDIRRSLIIEKWEEQATEILQEITDQRPEPNRKLDQFTATIPTTIQRANEIIARGDALNRKIIFLGDNDLVSVAVAISGQASELVVLDIDTHILKLVDDISEEKGLNIKTERADFRRSLPRKMKGVFNVVVSDPPYTPNGLSLFLNRAVEAIKDRYDSRLYLSFGHSDRARERELVAQTAMLDHGLLMNTRFPGFNRYLGAKSIGGTSALYLLDWTPKLKTVKTETKRIYTHE